MKIQLLIILLFLLGACTNQNKPSAFRDWYVKTYPQKNGQLDTALKRKQVFESNFFRVDTIFRSMKGPLEEKLCHIDTTSNLIWLTGYQSRVVNQMGESIHDGFMCHNNLNLTSNLKFPWSPKNFHYANRVFTLTQGRTSIQLPEGFGIPMPGIQPFNIVSQALNHNFRTIDTTIQFEVEIDYYRENEVDFTLTPLFMKTIWVVKQYQGPPGEMGTKPSEEWVAKDQIDTIYHEAQQPSCGVEMLANNTTLNTDDLYFDNYGRKYTGHWKIPPGKEYLQMDVTRMLHLEANRKVHYALAHVHPFCTSIELYDKTDRRSVFHFEMEQMEDGIGLKSIPAFSSKKGTDLFSDHQYELRSTYFNQSKDTLSAMTVVYLYVNE